MPAVSNISPLPDELIVPLFVTAPFAVNTKPPSAKAVLAFIVRL